MTRGVVDSPTGAFVWYEECADEPRRAGRRRLRPAGGAAGGHEVSARDENHDRGSDWRQPPAWETRPHGPVVGCVMRVGVRMSSLRAANRNPTTAGRVVHRTATHCALPMYWIGTQPMKLIENRLELEVA